jgi:hypothetical protein
VNTSTFQSENNELYLKLFHDNDESNDDNYVAENDSSLSLKNKLIIDQNDRLESLLAEISN